MIQLCPLFKRHYIFWVDDESGDREARNILEALEHKNLFHASIARGVYSSLQVLDAIRRNLLPAFDLAVIDVRLSNSKEFFSKIETVFDTAPPPLGPNNDVYEDNYAEFNKIERYSGPGGFNFNFSEIKEEVDSRNNGGLFVWAWAMQVCNEAKYVIYSANETTMNDLKFWKIAGVIDTCSKGEMFVTLEDSEAKSYFISKLIDVVGDKLRRGRVDNSIARALLEDKGTWTVQIGEGEEYRFENVPSVYAPLSVNVDFIRRTIMLTKDEAKETYLLAAFFLPWAKDLLSGDDTRVQSAINDIKATYGSRWRPALSVMKEFCDNGKPLHPFIEQTDGDKTADNAAKAREAYSRLGIKKYLSAATAQSLESYLGGEEFKDWQNIKHALELEIHKDNGLKRYFESEASKSDIGAGAFSINVMKNGVEVREISSKWYADVDWIKSVLAIVLNNLTRSKAFSNHSGEPRVVINLNVATDSATLVIQVQDNGSGFHLSREAIFAEGRGYSRFGDESESRLLRAYGRLFIESKNKKLEIGTGIKTRSDVCDGTVVTFEIPLG